MYIAMFCIWACAMFRLENCLRFTAENVWHIYTCNVLNMRMHTATVSANDANAMLNRKHQLNYVWSSVQQMRCDVDSVRSRPNSLAHSIPKARSQCFWWYNLQLLRCIERSTRSTESPTEKRVLSYFTFVSRKYTKCVVCVIMRGGCGSATPRFSGNTHQEARYI